MRITIKIFLSIFFLILIFFSYAVWDGTKTLSDLEKQKEYLNKVETISLFGMKFKDRSSYYILPPLNEKIHTYGQLIANLLPDGRLKGERLKHLGTDVWSVHNYFSVEVFPPLTNENFVQYFVSYNPQVDEIYRIYGVLNRKLSSFKNHEECINYLKPFIEIIDEGIRAKASFKIENNLGKYLGGVKQSKIKYRYNSGTKFLDDNQVAFTLEGKCQKGYEDKVFIILSDTFLTYSMENFYVAWKKREKENQLKAKEEIYLKMKKTLDRSGLK